MEGASLFEESYKFAEEIKITYTFPRGVAFPSGETKLRPIDGLADLKKFLSDKYEMKFFVYLKKSFMPAPDSRIGDLALCYGKIEADKQHPDRKNYTLPVECFPEPEYG